jgi:WD40 repeat protein
VKVHPDGSVDVILPPGKTQENRPDKTEATVTPEGSASPVPAKPNPQARKPSEPLSAMALVTRPAGLPGVRSWTIDTAAHHSGILAVAYHPGGQWLASGGCDGAVRLWPQGSGPARLLVGHHGPVQSLAWSPDGSLLASGGWDATIRLWDPRTGRLRWSHVRNAAFSWWIIEIAWSPDGTRLAFGTFDGAAEVLDMRSGRTLRALGYCEHSVCSMAWSPDGKTLAWGGYNEDIRISDVGSGNEVRRLPQQGKTFFQALAWSADGASLTSLSSDGTVRLWDIRTGKTIRQFPTVPFLGWTCNRWLSHDAKRLAMNDAGASRTEIWDATSGQRLLSLDPAGSIPYALDWSPDGRTMANGTVYGFIHFWDVRSGKLSRTLDGSTGYMRGPTAWSPDGKALVGSPEDSRLCVWDMASGRQVRRLPVNHGTSAAAWSPDAAQIAGADSGNSIFVWEAGWGKLVHKLQGHAAAVRTLTWAPHGDRLASGDERGGVMLWDTSSGKPWKTLRQGGSGPEIRFLAWSPDAQRLAVNGLGNKVEVWEAQSGRIVQSVPLDTPPLSAAWSPDGKTLACSRQDARNVLLWDAAKGAPKGIVEAGIVARAMTWRPDGNSLVLADFARIEQYDPRLCVRLSTAGVALPTFRRYHPNQLQVGDDWDVRQDEFSPDARHYASAGRDGAIRLIDTSTGHTVRTMLHLPASEHLTVSREGHYLGSPDVEKRLVYVVLTDDGEQLTLTPDEFTRRYGWKNDPAKVILLGEVAPPTANESQTQQQPAAPVKK